MRSLSLRNRRWLVATAGWIGGLAAGAAAALAGQGGQLRLEVIDRDTKEPIACRMHLTNAAKRPLKAPKVPFFHDHFVFSGSITIKLPEGEYAFEIERGPEYLVRLGHFSMQNFSDDTEVVDLKRFVDMAADGWWSVRRRGWRAAPARARYAAACDSCCHESSPGGSGGRGGR